MTININEIKKEKIYDVLTNVLGLEKREHQRIMFNHLLNTKDKTDIIIAPRHSGKTIISIMHIIRKLLQCNFEIALISNNIETSKMILSSLSSLIDTNEFITIFGININLDNIKLFSIYDKLPNITTYQEALFHDVGISTHKHTDNEINNMIENYMPIYSTSYHNTIIGTQEYYGDFYTKIKNVNKYCTNALYI